MYESVVPGAAERIIAMTEANSVGRLKLDEKIADAEIEASKQGLSLAFVLAFMCVVASIVFFAVGNVIAGSVFLGMPAAMLIKAFIVDR